MMNLLEGILACTYELGTSNKSMSHFSFVSMTIVAISASVDMVVDVDSSIGTYALWDLPYAHVLSLTLPYRFSLIRLI